VIHHAAAGRKSAEPLRLVDLMRAFRDSVNPREARLERTSRLGDRTAKKGDEHG
jgi:hypothetical protein